MARSRAAALVVLAGLALALAAAWTAGCSHPPVHVLSVHELAAALRAHGVPFTVEETAALTSVRAQGVRLAGKGLELNVYRIDDPKEMTVAARAAQMAQAASEKTAGSRPLQALVRGPFLVIVHAEPTTGQVAQALAEILPEQPGAPAAAAAR